MDTPAFPQGSLRGTWSPPLPDADGFTHTVVATPGLRTHVAAIGGGDAVVLLHGFPQHWWQWRLIAPTIAARGYRVICPDLRGSGWSEADDPGFERDSIRHDLESLLDALGIERAHLISHDLGAVVAGQFAYAHPERVRTAVQIAVPPGFMAFTPRLLPAFAHMPRMLMHREGQSLGWLFGPRYVAHPMSGATVDAYLRVQQRPEVSRAVRALYRGMIIPEVLRLARGTYKRMRLQPPTLAVFGRHDGPFTETLVRRICRDHERRAEHFELAFVEDAAHFVTDDAPAEISELALDWFERGDRAA
ncbi:alpha/beta fold hydrolase [Microbacterium sp. LWH12-1.2]|uniref:alpha/beta fold hydrolase n=1 Tax=Microbacterium sp. LWH12-1.2 TaxID=3135259 RepID=UPI003422C7BD